MSWRKSAEKPGSVFNRIQKLGRRVSKLVPPGFPVQPEGFLSASFKAFIWTGAGALRPNRDCLRICCLDLLNSNSAKLSPATSSKSEASRRAAGRFAWMLVSALIKTRTELLGMDALVSLCPWNTRGIMVWAWMLWSAHSSKHERSYGLGMDALVRVCSWNTKGTMI